MHNRILYGKNAPLHSQRIYVQVSEETSYLPLESQPYHVRPHKLSGLVIGGDWDRQLKPISACPKVNFCLLHWKDGIPWEETGCYGYLLEIIKQRGRVDGLHTLDDIKARYNRLDQIFNQVKEDGRLRNASELGRARKKNLENSGILIHLDRHGKPIFGGSGCHRIAMAVSLGIQLIPAKLGMVHVAFMPDWQKQLGEKGLE